MKFMDRSFNRNLTVSDGSAFMLISPVIPIRPAISAKKKERYNNNDGGVAELVRQNPYVMNEGDLKEAYDQHSAVIYGLCKRLVGLDAEDLLQTVFLSAWRSRGSFNPQKGSLKTWLYAITRSKAKDFYNKSQRNTDLINRLEDPNKNLEAETDTIIDSLVIEEALNTLPNDKRTVVELGFKKNLSHTEIANQTKIPLGTVKSHMKRSLAVMKKELGGSREQF